MLGGWILQTIGKASKPQLLISYKNFHMKILEILAFGTARSVVLSILIETNDDSSIHCTKFHTK